MTKQIKNLSWGGYLTPEIMQFDIKSEGVLCMSSPASTIDNAIEENWGTL